MSGYARTEPPEEFLSSGFIDPPRDLTPGVHFVTFGGGTQVYRRQAQRLAREASLTGWFSTITALTDHIFYESSWSLECQHARSQDYMFAKSNAKGFGYWIWKPALVAEMLQRLPKDDILVYADAGCELSLCGKSRFNEYVEMASRSGGLFFRIPFTEYIWNKMEVLSALGVTEEEATTPQIQATWFLIKNNEEGRLVVNEWLRLCRQDCYRLIEDTYDDRTQKSGFRAHRNDQSILSILLKRQEFQIIDWEDFFDGSFVFFNSWVLLFPFHSRRTRKLRLIFFLSRFSSISSCRKALRPTVWQRWTQATLSFIRRSLGWA